MMWKIVRVKGNDTIYEVSEYGDIRNLKTGQTLKHFKNTKGYHLVFLYIDGKKKTMRVSRLVAEAFKPVRFVGQNEVDHLGTKDENHYSKLDWVTHDENVRRAKKRKLFRPGKGEDNGNHRYSDDTVRLICKRLEEGKSMKSIVKEASEKENKPIHLSYVYRIKNGSTRTDISKQFNLS